MIFWRELIAPSRERRALADAARERGRQGDDDPLGAHAAVLVDDLDAVGVLADQVQGQPRRTASPSSSAARCAMAGCRRRRGWPTGPSTGSRRGVTGALDYDDSLVPGQIVAAVMHLPHAHGPLRSTTSALLLRSSYGPLLFGV